MNWSNQNCESLVWVGDFFSGLVQGETVCKFPLRLWLHGRHSITISNSVSLCKRDWFPVPDSWHSKCFKCGHDCIFHARAPHPSDLLAPVLLLCWLHAFSIRFLSNHAKHASGSCLRPPSVKPLRTTRFTCRWPEKYLRKYYIYRYTNIENWYLELGDSCSRTCK